MSAQTTAMTAASVGPPTTRRCRLCGAPLEHTFVDLGMSPPCEAYVTAERLD